MFFLLCFACFRRPLSVLLPESVAAATAVSCSVLSSPNRCGFFAAVGTTFCAQCIPLWKPQWQVQRSSYLMHFLMHHYGYHCGFGSGTRSGLPCFYQNDVASFESPIYRLLYPQVIPMISKIIFFPLEHFSREKIHKNSPLNTQSHSFVHQSSSSIIYDHIGCIHAWFCNITSCLVRFSLTSSNFSVFLNKSSPYLLVCSQNIFQIQDRYCI